MRQRMASKLLAILNVMVTVFSSRAFAMPDKVDLCVAPYGNDQNPGTVNKPFATPARARDAVRERIKAGLIADVTVLFRGGIYELNEPLTFGPEDSGSEKFSITYAAYPGEKPVISGGRKLAGWKKGQGQLWAVNLPDVTAGKWGFRQLFVNGQRAVRARQPNQDDKTPYVSVQNSSLDNNTFKLSFQPGLVKNWRNVQDVEIVCLGLWDITRKKLESVNEAVGEVVLLPPHCDGRYNTPQGGRNCFFENAGEFLDNPGEWYLDRRAGDLSYLPLQDQDMTKAQIVAPILSSILEIKGTVEQPVRNLHFKGLAFMYADWHLPEYGFPGRQAGTFYDPRTGTKCVGEAILWNFAEGCSLRDGEIAHVGGCGVSLRKGCVKNAIEGNHVFDIGSTGINVGEELSWPWSKPDYAVPAADVSRGNRVANNHIHACGAVLFGGVGVWTAFTDGTIVSHNLVHDMPYTGITVGFNWAPHPTSCKNNIVEFNEIHDVAKVLADGAGIYLLGLQPGTILRGNVIYDIRRSPYCSGAPNSGIYFDQDSADVVVDGNTIFGVNFHGGLGVQSGLIWIANNSRNITARNNILVPAEGQQQFLFPGADANNSKIENNTIIQEKNWKRSKDIELKAGLESAYRGKRYRE